ncbi:hypothetical protein QTP70_011067 [Hemibagrus guttatus]|uniref:SAM domain-containing protein n=1 Tax=Hemibagrus guttatus TaxID=175788 RepID=A0AAE0QSL8_9TELE|nr:hypothetical protein QTP70_011067 [Hemibagrus guttatus]
MFRGMPEADSSECLASMTPETQDIYLRMDHHRRRSGYRLGRIIARQQLLRRIAADFVPSTLLFDALCTPTLIITNTRLLSWLKKPEIEAKEACEWLRAAGFPQYAQLFEDSQFPIDITPVKKDHDFLDKDLVEPLCRVFPIHSRYQFLQTENFYKSSFSSEELIMNELFAVREKLF